ncbi:MAG: glycosyltransferase [Bacteroidales bacterium]|nr:glycosyltransferase [Bacteroidales bacterium]
MKILVALPRFPYPLDKGDKLRAFHQIRCLSEKNDILLFCVSHKTVPQEHIDILKPYCKAIKIVKPSQLSVGMSILRAFFSIDSLQVSGYWNTKKIRREYSRFEKQQKPDVLFCQMVRTMEWVKKSKVPKLLDFQDCLSKNIERRMYKSKGLTKRILHFEFKMLRSCEYDSFDMYDEFTIISEPDREAIPHRQNDNIKILPNGVDTSYYQPQETEKKYDLLFCGNMHYKPNVDAALFLVNDVMPIVWKSNPNIKVAIAGTNPTKSVKQLASNNVIVTGWVPDMREYYAQSKVFVAPMQIGTGLQNKILEAMAMKVPCITSALANDSLKAENGKQVLVAKEAQEYANYISDILGNEAKATSLAEEGHKYVVEKYSWSKYSKDLETMLHNIAKK